MVAATTDEMRSKLAVMVQVPGDVAIAMAVVKRSDIFLTFVQYLHSLSSNSWPRDVTVPAPEDADVATIGVTKLKLVAMVLVLVAVVEATIDVKILKPEGTALVPAAVVTAMVAPESSR